jgi:hypothetical protein
MNSKEVKSKVRKIRAKWSRELVYDLNSFSGFDDELEKEILKSLRREKRQKSIKNIFQ